MNLRHIFRDLIFHNLLLAIYYNTIRKESEIPRFARNDSSFLEVNRSSGGSLCEPPLLLPLKINKMSFRTNPALRVK
jgi:hypothetical protein